MMNDENDFSFSKLQKIIDSIFVKKIKEFHNAEKYLIVDPESPITREAYEKESQIKAKRKKVAPKFGDNKIITCLCSK